MKAKAVNAKPYLLIAPSIVLLCVFCIYPIFSIISLSFYQWDMVTPFKKFVGLENFITLLGDAQFYRTLANTVIYVVCTVGFGVSLGLSAALYLSKKTRINSFLQSVAFTPYIVSLASIAMLWMWLMNKDFGLLNAVLAFVGAPPVDWLGNPRIALASLILIAVWKSVGYNALILVSALQTIPPYLYEAAKLDRAGAWSVFRKITFPMISPTVFFLTLVDAIASFKVFETIQIITEGGPQNATNTLVFSLYEYGFRFYKVGYAAAIGVVLLAIILIFTALYFKVLSKRVHYQ
ncbi:carbohydrate ABC transporter permease [Enterocloster lavalensis]|uniref:carbohydrate ABC transporter permease n=1 Tax=Enterocloster lavalensis TaxID=460384 RepID=UPI001D0795BB|nr:sugar ABC transporter permease [Enterocloster lavalensis]MCB6346484.1 sugar ABC transporter permease [Enterocloster lavalensis]